MVEKEVEAYGSNLMFEVHHKKPPLFVIYLTAFAEIVSATH
jgi:hypothetical protein